ncbi:rod shape-determining protein MreC [Candidatus Parcubacteria bacterium]|nr:rod shape-determining protein MreC [Candidatus Parcubacteria bacterium]
MFVKKKIKLQLFVISAVMVLSVFLFKTKNNIIANSWPAKIFIKIQSQTSVFFARFNKSFSIFFNNENALCDIEKIIENRLIVQQEKNKILIEENENLKSTLNFLSDSGYLHNNKDTFASAYIISKDQADQSIIIINKGLKDGLRAGMPIIKDRGILIGKIIKTGDFISYVILTTDNRSQFAVSINNEEKISGLACGNYNLTVRMDLIPIDKDIQIGDIVVTSGSEKFIPPGLIVGKIVKINKNDNDIFQSAELAPLLPMDNLNIVTILKNE